MALIPVAVNNKSYGNAHFSSLVILGLSAIETPYDPHSDGLVKYFSETRFGRHNLGCLPGLLDPVLWDYSIACYNSVLKATAVSCELCGRNIGEFGDFIVVSKDPALSQWVHILCLSNQLSIISQAAAQYTQKMFPRSEEKSQSLSYLQLSNSKMFTNCLAMVSELTQITSLLSAFHSSIQHDGTPEGDIKQMLSDLPRAHQLSKSIQEELLSGRDCQKTH